METEIQDSSPTTRTVTVEPRGKWQVVVRVEDPNCAPVEGVLDVPPPTVVQVHAEVIDSLPVFQTETASGWAKGRGLGGVTARECTTCCALAPDSLRVVVGTTPDGEICERGRDYELDPEWGTIGRLPDGRIRAETSICLCYTYTPQRLDSVFREPGGTMNLRTGVPHIATPHPPALEEGNVRLANIHTEARMTRLDPAHCFPILEAEFPALCGRCAAEVLLPRTMRRLRAGDELRVLAWGDSVTEGAFLDDSSTEGWQVQFAARLSRCFPQASIDLTTEAWGGRNTSHYMAEPPGALHNYKEKVLDARPDLVIMEFLNDAGLSPGIYHQRYEQLLKDLRGIGAELVILTPNYTRPEWMNFTRQREIDDDPRPYTHFLRAFAATHGIALADAAQRYGRLWRQGIPYNTLMTNNINHPDPRGMRIFADSLMSLWSGCSGQLLDST